VNVGGGAHPGDGLAALGRSWRRAPLLQEDALHEVKKQIVGEGREDLGAEETAASRPPANSEPDDPDLVLFLTVATVIFAALWFGLSMIAGAL
jgi:hypothetical protein